MRVADEYDLRIFVFETELFDAVPDQREVAFEIRVDQNVALRCIDQVDGEIGRADVI